MIDPRATAANGTFQIADTDEHEGLNCCGFVAAEGAAFTSLKGKKYGKGTEIDLLEDMGLDGGAECMNAWYTPPEGYVITTVKLSAEKINLSNA